MLFDVFADTFSPVPYRRLMYGWQHLFRCAILKWKPAGKLAEHFDPEMGRPTKELYSIAGLLFIMEFRDEYRVRGGVESTNSILKRVTSLDRLRVRSRPAVYWSILLKVADWDLKRAASVRSLIAKMTKGGKHTRSARMFRTISEFLHCQTSFLNGFQPFTVA